MLKQNWVMIMSKKVFFCILGVTLILIALVQGYYFAFSDKNLSQGTLEWVQVTTFFYFVAGMAVITGNIRNE